MKAKKILRKIEDAIPTQGDNCKDKQRVDCIVACINSYKSEAKNTTERLAYLEKHYAELDESYKGSRIQVGILTAAQSELERKLATKNADDSRELKEARDDSECCRRRVEDVKRQLIAKEGELGSIKTLVTFYETFTITELSRSRSEQPIAWAVYDRMKQLEVVEGKLKLCQESNRNIQENTNRQIAEAKNELERLRGRIPELILTDTQAEVIKTIDEQTNHDALRSIAKEFAKKLYYLEGRYKELQEKSEDATKEVRTEEQKMRIESVDLMKQQLDLAVKAEREECATVVENQWRGIDDWISIGDEDKCLHSVAITDPIRKLLAWAIRERK